MQWEPARPAAQPAAGAEASLLAHRRAMQHSDEVVQQLAVAKYALSVSDVPRAMSAIDAALDMARRSLSDLLDLVSPAPTRAASIRHSPEPRQPTD